MNESVDSQFPSRDKGNGNETLSCCIEETVAPPGDWNDLDVRINSCSYALSDLQQSSNLVL